MNTNTSKHILFDTECCLYTIECLTEDRMCRHCGNFTITINIIETPQFCFCLDICPAASQSCSLCAYIFMDVLQNKVERTLNFIATRIQRWYLHHKYKPGGSGYKKALQHWNSMITPS